MKEFTINKGFLNNKKSFLTIDENALTLDRKVFRRDEITGIRYGIHFIRGYMSTIGREYQIFIKNVDNKEIKISFRLFYGRKLKEKHLLFCKIIDTLWHYFFYGIVENYLDKYKKDREIAVSGIKIFSDKISFANKEIPLEQLRTKTYHHYFILFSEDDHYTNKMLYYLKDQDAVILLEILNQIKK